MRLTVTAIRQAKPKAKSYKLFDGRGLYLLVSPNGSKYWRLKYRFAGKEKLLSLGVFPDVSLTVARGGCEEARRLLRSGQDPAVVKRKHKLISQISSETSFEHVAHEWIASKHTWSADHAKDVQRSLEVNVFPDLGRLPIREIDTSTIRAVLESIQSRGSYETASRVRQRCSSVFKYAMAVGYVDRDPAEPLKSIMVPPKRQNFASISPKELPEFLSRFAAYQCTLQTRLAVRLLMLTFVRTSELIEARWSEIEFDEAIWNIPAERMKKDRPHFVPLSRQAIQVLRRQQQISGAGELVFPHRSDPRKPMSNGTILRVIDRIGYKGRMTGHGFRSLASTVLNESGEFRVDAIEQQLSHEDDNAVRRAYNKARYMDERREMMQWWADRLDELTRQSEVVPIAEFTRSQSL